jgi:TatA/E family protein of Tat protein translocase
MSARPPFRRRGRSKLEEIEMFGLSASHLMLFAIVALLLFGKRLPGTMRSLGESLREFRNGLNSSDDNQGEIAR